MAGSFSSVYLHIVFSTHRRQPYLVPEQREAIFAYMAGLLRNIGCQFALVNGVADHVHVVCTLPVSVAQAELVAKLKGNSSHWIRDSLKDMQDFRWQTGYAAFSFSRRQLPAVCRYVDRQEAHHRTRTFEDEYREFLKMAAIEFEERYVFG